MNQLKCNDCGRFVSYDDLSTGRALHRQLTPDSFCTWEEWETLCPEHVPVKVTVTQTAPGVYRVEGEDER